MGIRWVVVLGLVSSVALADPSVGVPPPSLSPPTRVSRLVSTDGGVASSGRFTFYTADQSGTPTSPARAVLLYVSEVETPGQVTLRLADGGSSASAVVDQPGWHEWELPSPTEYGAFVLETVAADVTFKFTCFDDYSFPSQRDRLGVLYYPSWGTCTGVLRLVGGGYNTGCPAPNDDRLAGIPYVETTLLPAGVERQRMRVRGWDLVNNPVAVGWVQFAPDPVQLIGFDGRVQGPDAQGRFVHAVTDLTDGGMAGPFFIDFPSDGGNLWAAYSHPPDPCHPAARASLDGEESRWMSGPLGADLVFRLYTALPWPRYLDLDGDGFAGSSFEWRTDGPGPTGGDCDDADPSRRPGAPELCNGADDDCDGTVDGAGVVAEGCERTAGICSAARHQPSDCQGGAWLSCEARGRYPASFSPEETRCDAVDEDCDGTVDDSPTPVSCPLTLGVCSSAPLNTSCVSGAWAACDYGPGYELLEASCDGLDNDCDGLTDAADLDLPLRLCESQGGVCSGATHSREECGATGWAACTEEDYGAIFEPREVSCDGLDNDCDGLVDANDPDLGAVLCENQAGVCAGLAHLAEDCAPDGWRACAPARLPPTWQASESRCDGLDNDCDGATDEGCAPSPAAAGEPKAEGCTCANPGGLGWGLLLIALLVRSRTRT